MRGYCKIYLVIAAIVAIVVSGEAIRERILQAHCLRATFITLALVSGEAIRERILQERHCRLDRDIGSGIRGSDP